MKKYSLIGLFTVVLTLLGTSFNAQDGAALFKEKCASCHKVVGGTQYPQLQGAKQIWADAGEGELIYEWVNNNQDLIASGKSKRAKEVYAQYKEAKMTAFPDLTREQIDAIFAYADSYVPPPPPEVATPDDTNGSKGGFSYWWFFYVAALLVVIFAAVGARKRVQYALASQNGEELDESKSWSEKLGLWIYKNWLFALVIFVVLLFGGIADLFGRLYQIGVVSDYQPSQVIPYDHKLHAGTMEIDCKYCHNSVMKSKHAGIPTTNVCMNCHKVVWEGKKPGSKEAIKLIHDAAGFSQEKGDYNRDANGNIIEGKPIVWNKAHNLPDHVFFSHKQHVNVGKIDCMQCHGDVKTFGLGRVASTEEINALVKDNKDKIIPLTKPLLTMGWCIECHQEKGIDVSSTADNAYYQEIHDRLKHRPDVYQKYLNDDQKISVEELGGWECAKCHY